MEQRSGSILRQIGKRCHYRKNEVTKSWSFPNPKASRKAEMTICISLERTLNYSRSRRDPSNPSKRMEFSIALSLMAAGSEMLSPSHLCRPIWAQHQAVLWLLLTNELPALTSWPPTLLNLLDYCRLTPPVTAKNLSGIKDQTWAGFSS